MEWFNQVLSLGPIVVMPIIFFVFGLIFRLPVGKAFNAAMTVGIGFEGIIMVVTMFLTSLGPVTADMVQRLGVELTVMDVGWATSASVAWSSPLVPFVVTGAILLNIVLLILKKTKILNIDMFNYWLILIVGTLGLYKYKQYCYRHGCKFNPLSDSIHNWRFYGANYSKNV
jgi:PTS system galactitol-specific IIC component